jgi:tetratricopeptide (TPR) repeat protein
VGEPLDEQAQLAARLLEVGWGTFPNERSREIGWRAIALAEETGDARAAGVAHTLMILIELQLGDAAEAERQGERALAVLEPLGESPELAEALHRIGWLSWRQGVDATDTLQRSVDMATRLDARVELAGATHTLAAQLSQNGRASEALATIETAFELAKQVDDQLNLLRIYTNFASLLAQDAFDLPRALAIAEEGLEVSRRAGARGFVAWQLENAGWILAEMGRLQEAEATLREGIEHADAVGDGPLLGFQHQDLARTLIEQGRIDEGREVFERSEELLRDRGEGQGASRRLRLRAMLATADGDAEGALRSLREGVEPAVAGGVNADPWLFLDLLRALGGRGAHDEAEQLLGVLDARETSPAISAVVALGRGMIASDQQAAIASIAGGVDELDRLGARVQQARGLALLAEATRRAGDDASEPLSRARDLLEECGARFYLPEVASAGGDSSMVTP